MMKMFRSAKFSIIMYYVINCCLIELISCQPMNDFTIDDNQTVQQYDMDIKKLLANLTELEFKQINFDKLFNSTNVNICDSIDCNANIAFCELNHCPGLDKAQNLHYVITCLIVAGVAVLLLATLYACHKENKRSEHWRNAFNRSEDHVMALRLLQTITQNRIPPVNPNNMHQEMMPLTTSRTSGIPPVPPPPPYDYRYTPPPDYQFTRHQSTQTV
ncbi:uncharacterized protein LOC128961004 [Oppia nitens]|uniref:uncharacterized protein LOC128961004 n=1 Tax=Oppia nitens TaxID=1686743 RepID=UPI0023DB43A5|nr:uncharacterized protein LOC128961004 [Oppia nitens]